MKRLNSEGPEQCFSIPEPAEDGAWVSVDWTVEHSRATLGDCLRRVGFTLQYRRLWRHTARAVITRSRRYQYLLDCIGLYLSAFPS